ncbi:hypothetical protein [Roseateles terrae]|uniref:Uncharacterized protein n=1 Tax=Roseateles terrae TaxID=431060 RepID=A0ABR6GQH1_9BURK|nr:hypothetical protein [Roseateles terrae]MBB3194363.1 hypothetical protein [Roseateles terrae]
MPALGAVHRPTGCIDPELVARLLDERYRFPSHDHRTLCEWLPAVLPQCRSWPAGAALTWEEATDPAAAGTPHRPVAMGQTVLRLAPQLVQVEDGSWVVGLAGQWCQSDAAAAARPDTALPARCTAPPGDLFDALALALNQRAASLPGAVRHAGRCTGMRLRQELADWLQTPAGRQCEGPRLTTASMESGDETLLAELTTFIREELSAGNATMACTLAPFWRPGPADHPLDRVLHTLRSGGWCDLLDHLVPTVLVRLPSSHRCHSPGLAVTHAGQKVDYGWPGNSKTRLCRWSDGCLTSRVWSNKATIHPPGPDSFLEGALGLPVGRLNQYLPGVRDELASIMDRNRTLLDVRLALAERAYPCDHEVLLRMCLVGGALTLAGEQLLHPERPQRAATADDLQRWFEPTRSAHARDAAAVAAEGISVVDSYRLASPMRPTAAGTALIAMPHDRYRYWHQQDAPELLSQRIPELLYAWRAMRPLLTYLRIGDKALKTLVPAERLEYARRFCAAAAAADRLNMPPSGQGSALNWP